MERKKLIEDSFTKEISEINPIVAIPYSTSVYSISLTKGPKWLFTGGEDGLIRKFDFFQSVEGKSLLTVSQRHQLIDSILFNGMICSYWENEIPYYKSDLLSKHSISGSIKKQKNDINSFFEPNLSPVYSLYADIDGFWILSGLKNGSITLQSIRSNEGSIQWYFKNSNDKNISIEDRKYYHSNTVSSLITNSDQSNFLSGSWDRKILKWDLNSGKNMNLFTKSTGQISSLQYRPIIGSDMNWQPKSDEEEKDDNDDDDDDDDMGSLFDDDDVDDNTNDKNNDNNNDNNNENRKENLDTNETKNVENESSDSNTEKLAKTEPDVKRDIEKLQKDALQSGNFENSKTCDNIFLSSSIDGSINIWDSRISHKSNNVETFTPLHNTPPWCMSATWSVDGDSIFVGRRNATVEEFDIRYPSKIKNLLNFPNASGSIGCVRTLTNKNYILCGCQDNIRLYDLRLIDSSESNKRKKIPFTIIPGHNGGIISDLYVDPTCRFMVSSSGNRGWQGKSNDYIFIYEII